ncbi:unnamed protein product [Rodentolepis nana]|uniref:TPX2_importin domain-containing protein n=1 Tax=Rodentolepis nana TaxID=102285 RepID=A0A0R3TV73_RODNA|nr:unnamed protein product [Rodentolepis nana]
MDSNRFPPTMLAVINKYASMEVDDSEGEELDYYINQCPLNYQSESLQSRQNCLIESTSKFIFGNNVDSTNKQDEHSNPLVKRKRSPCAPNFEPNVENEEKKNKVATVAPFELLKRNFERLKRRHSLPSFSGNMIYLSGGRRLSPQMACVTLWEVVCLFVSPLDDHFMIPPQHSGNVSLSPRRVFPFEAFERNYGAHTRRHSVSPSRSKPNVENEEKKNKVATVAPFELLKRNFERLKRRHSLPSFSGNSLLAESTPETGRVPIIASRQAFDLSRAVPNWFTPPRASTVRLSRSVLARHSLSSSTLPDNSYSPDSRLLSWVKSQLKP